MSDDKAVRPDSGGTEETVKSTASEEAVQPDAVRDPEAAGNDSKDPVADTSPEAEGAGPAPRAARALIAALVAATVLLLAAVGVAGYLYVHEQDKSATLTAYEEARQAACRYAPVLANYDAKNLDPYFAAVTAGATGDWKKEFETTTTELREALAAGQVVSTAGDIQCAVKTADATSAEVVVVIGQTISSLGTRGQPAPGQLSMVMRMQKIDGNWLVGQMITPLAPNAAP